MSALPRDPTGSSSCRTDSIACQCERPCKCKRNGRTSLAVFSLYPSRAAVESVRIPSCQAVFADADRRRKIRRGKRSHKDTLRKNEKEDSDELDSKSFASCFLHERKSVPPHHSSGKEAPPTPRSKASVVFPGVGRGSNIPARLRSKALWSSQRGVDHKHPIVSTDSSSVTSTSVTSVTSVHTDTTAHSFQKPTTAAPTPPRTELEVSPGVFLPLYGAKETMAAFDSGSLIPASCLICEMELQCVEAAEYVLCPVCKVVSPVLNGKTGNGAVGLGMAVSA